MNECMCVGERSSVLKNRERDGCPRARKTCARFGHDADLRDVRRFHRTFVAHCRPGTWRKEDEGRLVQCELHPARREASRYSRDATRPCDSQVTLNIYILFRYYFIIYFQARTR